MTEERVKISNIVTLILHPTAKTLGSATWRTRESVLGLLRIAKGNTLVMRRLIDLLPSHGQSITSEDDVIASIAQNVLNHRIVLQLNILPPRQSRIKLRTLWQNYPNEIKYPTTISGSNSIWQLVGGKVLYNATHADPAKPKEMIFANSCATRMSRAFNKSGLAISYIPGQSSSGGDHTWHIYRVDHFRPEVVKEFGASTTLDKANWKEEMKGQPGIVLFTSTFSDATGHVTLWNGSDFVNGFADENDARPSVLKKVEFWEVPW